MKRFKLPPASLGRKGLVALSSGLLMALAVPPFSLWPVAWVALAPLYGLCSGGSLPGLGQSAVYGLAWGVGFYGASLAWITHLHPLTWMGVPWLGSVAIAAFAWGVVTAWGTTCVVIWCIGVNRVQKFPLFWRILLAATLWCVLETLRNLSPLDWVSLALTQSPHNLIALHLDRLSGPTTVVALIVAVNGLLAEAWKRRQREARAGWLPLSMACVMFATGHLIGASFHWSTEPSLSPPLQIGLIQGNVPTREKLTQPGIREAWATYLRGYRSLVDQGADAVLTPEGALPVVWRSRLDSSNPLVQAVQETGIPLWLGTFVPAVEDSSRLTQSLIEIGPQGRLSGRYNKIKLVPLGEYLPLENLLGSFIGRLSPLDSYLLAGDRHQQFRTRLGPATVSICYESAYSSLLRRQTAAGGEFILTASNNDPYPAWMMIQHHALDVMRAVETDRWAVRATNTGLSGVVDNQGNTLWRSVPDTVSLHLAKIQARHTQTPYVRWGDWLLWGLLGTSVLGLSVAKPKKQSKKYPH